MKTVTLADFLTDEEIKEVAGYKNHKLILDRVIKPNIERINASLGQENDAHYLAYAVAYAVTSGRP